MSIAILERFRQSYKVRQALGALDAAVWRAVSPVRRLALARQLGDSTKDVHIHFGCGLIDDPRFVNIDARPLRHVHVISKSPMLAPFPSGRADSIYACHVFEHIPYAQQKAVLERWLAVLKPGGRLRISVPDFEKLLKRYEDRDRDVSAIQGTLMGGQDYPGNFHFAIFTQKHLSELLASCGFVEIGPWHPANELDWPRDWSWYDEVSLNVTAIRPRQ